MNTKLFILALISFIVVGCTVVNTYQFNERYGTQKVQPRLLEPSDTEAKFFTQQVKPILDNRCLSCHACYDSPCQLQISSAEGIDRGVHHKSVYSGSRLLADKPTRLFIDKQTTEQWRGAGFRPVLNERNQNPEANKAAGLLYQSLLLKQEHPLPTEDILSKRSFNFSLNRSNSCPSAENFELYAKRNPLAGMPYGLPGISTQEMDTLTQWIEAGGQMASAPPLTQGLQKQVDEWEAFLNQDTLKSQLVSRYIYEHLFLANIHFNENPHNDSASSSTHIPRYFKLVRSSTPPGQAINLVVTRRPYGDPKVSRVYYRLQAMNASLIHKTHLPYAFNEERMQWIKQLFFTTDYEVTELPGYNKDFINPFITFTDLPANSRYRFMLEEAKFIIEGFIKGPVCRGQVAVDVINDHFWVFFVDPESDAIPKIDSFLAKQSKNLRLPGESGSNAAVLTPWINYSKANREYLLAKRTAVNDIFSASRSLNEKLIWDGDGNNPNAALTIFRNFDSASVVKGLVGQAPKTAWIIDYPLLERIHYLLTVDFDVYGNLGHQLNTRLYMDFLRIEGEYNFLLLLPTNKRFVVRDYWYRNSSENVREYLYSCNTYLSTTPSINYQSNDSRSELLNLLAARVSPAISDQYSLNSSPLSQANIDSLESLHRVRGNAATILPEVSHVLVTTDSGEDILLTLKANRAHSNITSLFLESKNRLPAEDSITVAYGVIGSYTNAFFHVNESSIDQFVESIKQLRDEDSYQQFKSTFGIRRTDPRFWAYSDKIHQTFVQQQPETAARLDFNRLENR